MQAQREDFRWVSVHRDGIRICLRGESGEVLPGFTSGGQAFVIGQPGARYAFMIVMPLTGWMRVSAGERPLNWFGLFDIPKFAVTKGDAVVGVAHEGHEVLGLVWLALLVLHVAAALRHHFALKDTMLRRML